MPKDLFDLDDSLLEEAAPKKAETNYEVELKKARALCIRGQYERALEIYNGILDEDFENEEALIGILRVHSKDFTEFEGKEIDQDIHAVESMCPDTMNDEYLAYLKKRKDAVATKKTVKPVEEVKPVEKPKDTSTVKKTTTTTNKTVVSPSSKPAPKVESPEEKLANEAAAMDKLYWDKKYDQCAPTYKKWADTLPTSNKLRSTSGFRYGYICATQYNDGAAAVKYYDICINNAIRDQNCVPHAYYNSALYFHSGDGVKKDLNKAIDYMKKAADLGNESAKTKLTQYQKEAKDSVVSSSGQVKIDKAKSLFDNISSLYKNKSYSQCCSYFKDLLDVAIDSASDGTATFDKITDYVDRAKYFYGCALRGLKDYANAESILLEFINYAEKTNDFELRFAYWELAMLYRYDKPDTFANKHQAYIYYSKGAALGSDGCKNGMNDLSKYR